MSSRPNAPCPPPPPILASLLSVCVWAWQRYGGTMAKMLMCMFFETNKTFLKTASDWSKIPRPSTRSELRASQAQKQLFREMLFTELGFDVKLKKLRGLSSLLQVGESSASTARVCVCPHPILVGRSAPCGTPKWYSPGARQQDGQHRSFVCPFEKQKTYCSAFLLQLLPCFVTPLRRRLSSQN